jgi:predicted secreted Zn-dependent protease
LRWPERDRGVAAFGLLLAAPALAADGIPVAFAGVPNVEIVYYDVSGTNAKAIRKSLDARRLRDPNDGKAVDAMTHWRIAYGWRVGGPEGCDLAEPKVTYRAEVTLPRLADEERLPRKLLIRWRRYVAALGEHEAGHVRYPFEHVGDVATAIRASSCETARQAAAAAIAALAHHDSDYDRATRHGASQGATFP